MLRRPAPLFVLLALLLGAGSLVAQQAPAEAKWYDRIRFEGDFRPRFDMTYQDMGQGKGVAAWMPPFMIAAVLCIIAAGIVATLKQPKKVC